MDHLRALVTHFKEKHPDLPFPRPSAELFTHIQTTLLPNVLAVVQKDNALFKGYGAAQIFPGIAIETIWDSSDESWKKLHMALLYSLMQGDPKEKKPKILETVRKYSSSLIPSGKSRSNRHQDKDFSSKTVSAPSNSRNKKKVLPVNDGFSSIDD